MNILNLLIKEERFVGVEISNKFIRIAYFRPKEKSKEKMQSGGKEFLGRELVLIEEPISKKVISEGIVIDKESLGKILKDIWVRAKLNTHYAIIAIPPDKIYSRTFLFPKAINQSRLEEAVNLAIDFQLPMKKIDAYIGWENVGDFHVSNEVLISAIPKTIVDGYSAAVHYAGIKVLALESHLASIGRAIKLEKGLVALITKSDSDENTMFILKDGIMSFSRTIPVIFMKEASLAKEIEHIKIAFESDKKIAVTELPFTKTVIRDEYLKYPELQKLAPEIQSKWSIALGAAIRGEIPKGTDNHISLLPVGTAEAYAYQKTTTFVTLIRNLTIGVSIFFLTAFVSAYLFVFYLSQTTSSTNLNISISQTSKDALAKENQIKKINGMTSASKEILSITPNWSILLDDINSRTVGGITISNFSATSIADSMSIVGIAKDRNRLNQLKKSFQESAYLTAVELPITNLEKKGDIPFSISFRLKDPTLLYYK